MSFDPYQRRVVVTGMGVVAQNGKDLQTFWSTIRKGISAAAPVTRFDVSNLPSKIAAEVKNFNGRDYMDPKTARRLDRSLLFSVAAAVLAKQDARIDFSSFDPDRVGVVEATSVSNNEMSFKSEEAFTRRGYRGLSPYTLINGYCGGGSGEIAHEIGAKGHSITCSSGSASGNDAVGYAFDMVQRDEVDAMVAGGAEAPILPPLWGAFCLSKVMTARNEAPQQAMRPFDRTRDGFLLGEGAAFLVLEEISHALSRGAKIYAEILGHGRSCEAYHPVAPHPEGIGVYRAMEKALRRARLHTSEIDYINAHGTATESGDVVETKAINRLFGEHARRIAVSSTKPVTGHLLAAAGALETVICSLAVHEQVIPLTLNFEHPAEGCDLDYVPVESRPYPLRSVMNLSSGFGGKNSCLILRRYVSGSK